jgi:hypothetical protein
LLTDLCGDHLNSGAVTGLRLASVLKNALFTLRLAQDERRRFLKSAINFRSC